MAKILIVEDSKFQRNNIKKILLSDGHEVFEAENGQIGLDTFEKENFDLVVSDLVMPVVDGFGLLEGLKKKKTKTPVIVLTADIQPHVKERCLELGAIAFLNKPLKSEEIRSVIENLG